MKNAKVGDMVSTTYNYKTIAGKLKSISDKTAEVYITDKTGSYTITVPIESLTFPFTGEPLNVFEKDGVMLPLEEEVSKPKRYNKVGSLECWDVILDQKMDFLEGSVLKYLWRHKEKNGKHDLKKAKEYLEKMIADYDKLYDNE